MNSPEPASERPGVAAAPPTPEGSSPTSAPAGAVEDMVEALSDRLMKAAVRSRAAQPTDEDLDAMVEAAMGGVTMQEIADRASAPRKQSGVAGMKTGRITRVAKDDVFVDVGGKSDGVLPKSEFDDPAEIVVGREISVSIERYDPTAGALVLSKRNADRAALWASLKVGDVLDGLVTGMNKGGLELRCGGPGGIRAFMPVSQVDTRRIADVSVFLMQQVRCKVTAIDAEEEEIVVSRRAVLEEEQAQTRRRLLNELQEGDTRTGTVRNITEFGAFVDLGGVDGLLHIGDISWARVRSVGDVLKVGDVLECRVLKVDRDQGKVSLGLKQIKPDPWTGIQEKYPVGSRVAGKVVRLAPFGAFVELEEGVDGLVHISEMSWIKRLNHPSEVVKEGDAVQTVVLKVDPEKRELKLSLRQIAENPWAAAAAKYPVNSIHKGKVTRTGDFGAFVELEPGIEGLVHISELSDKHVVRVADVVAAGKEVDVRVLSIDPDNCRASLSIRQAVMPAAAPVAPPPATGPAGVPAAPPAPVRKRDKPLRGGLGGGFNNKIG